MDHPSRPFIALAVAALLGAGTAAGQTPGTPAPPAPHSLWFDAAALADDEILAGVEALTLGRVSLGASIGYSHAAHPRNDVVYPMGYAYPAVGVAYPQCDPRMLMECDYFYPGDTPRYRAWTAAFTVRFYPASFSFRNGASRMQVYAGGHAAYRWSSWDESIVYNGCPYCAYPLGGSASGGAPLPSPADSVIVMPPNPYPYPPILGGTNPVRHSRGSFEPGLDVGVRLLPIGPLFVEVGGRFTLVTADDAMRRTMQGDVESRLVLAAGLAW